MPATTVWTLLGLAFAMLTAWAVRSLLSSKIFLDDGIVLLGMGDSAYHTRRALYSFTNFPAVLLNDPYMAPRRSFIPYKLFERVAGANIEIAAPPGADVELELDLETPLGRRLVFEISSQADADGRAVFRVSYATDVAPPVHATGPYRVRVHDEVRTLEVSDEAVRSSAKIVFA